MGEDRVDNVSKLFFIKKYMSKNFLKTKLGKALLVLVSASTVAFMLGAIALPSSAQAAALTSVQVESIIGLLSSFGADASTIANVRASLTGSTPVVTTTPATTGATCGYNFAQTLSIGSTGTDVMNLQKVLNTDPDTMVASTGIGSVGNESSYYGALTQSAVTKFQNKYASEVLGSLPTSGTYPVGPGTRAKLNALYGGACDTATDTTTDDTTTDVVIPSVGTGLTITAAAQPTATLAVKGATRLPFTKVVLTAGTDGDVTVNSFLIERTGLANDAAFDGIILLDEEGNQIGIAKTLNSLHQATVGSAFVVKAGTSKTITVAGNMDSSLTGRGGEVPYLSVMGVNTSAIVTGDLPVTGTGHTVNNTLSIGSVTMLRGGIDPGADQSKEVGTTGYTFSSVRITAGTNEKVLVKSIRWYQSGSATSEDLENVKTYVGGTAYDVVVDGKYYTSTFGDGILVDKGGNIEVSIKGDVVGGAARTVDFDIYKRTDIYVVGENYGFGITPPNGADDTGTDDGAFHLSTNPWYDAFQVTVSTGSLSVSVDTAVTAQNIAVNLSEQVLGGYIVTVRGEEVSVAQMVFNVMATGNEVSDITSVSLVNENGSPLAGPVDGVDTTDPAGTFTFTDTVTFPVGITKVKLIGKLGTDFVSTDSVQASTTPSTGWTTVTGQVTGNTITPTPSTALTSSSMSVRAGSLAISVSGQPTARSVIAGANQFEFARYVFDASQSGEDVRITSIPLLYTFTTISSGDLTNCYLYDESTKVTSNNVKNPTVATDNTETYIFDGTGLIVPKGTAKTVSLKCDVATGATSGTVQWGLDALSSYSSATGMTSGQTISETATAATGQSMAMSSGGSYTVTEDTSLKYAAVKAGSTNVTLARFQFTAGVEEDVDLKQIALELTNTASSAPRDLIGEKVTLWKGTTMLGTAQFGLARADYATSTLSTSVIIPAGETIAITVKGDLISHDQNTNTTSTANNGGYGAFIAISYDANNNGLNGNYGVGLRGTISGTTATDVSSDGIRVFRNVPTFAVTSTTGGALLANDELYKFTVNNPDSRALVLKKVSFSIATSGTAFRIEDFTLYDGNGVAANAAAVDATDVETAGVTLDAVEIVFDATSDAKLIPANSTKSYVLKAATVTNGTVTDSVSLALLADQAYPSLEYLMGQYGTSAGQLNLSTASTTNNIIWSPFSTTSPVATSATESNLDWTNGYGLPGFPAVGQNFPTQTWTKKNN